MAKYLTPAVLRAIGTGLNLTNVPDTDLAGLIAEAETMVDTFMGFREDQQGFATGQRVSEKQPWTVGSRRIYPHCFPTPIQSIQKLEIVVSQQAGTGAFIEAVPDVTTALINNDEGYVELVALSVIAYGLTPVLAQLSIVEVFSALTYTAGYDIAKVAWPLYASDAGNTVFHSLLPFWDTTIQTPQVYINGSLQASGYTVDGTNGRVLFATPVGSNLPVTASFTHTIPDQVVTATKEALLEEPIERYVLNRLGMAGMEAYRSGVRSTKRRLRDPAYVPQWQKTLATMQVVQVMSVGN